MATYPPTWSSRYPPAANGTLVATLAGHEGAVSSIDFMPDGHRLVSAGADRSVRAWNIDEGTQLWLCDRPLVRVNRVRCSPVSARIAAAGDGVAIIDAATGRTLLQREPHPDTTWSIDWSRDGQRLSACCLNGTIAILDAGR